MPFGLESFPLGRRIRKEIHLEKIETERPGRALPHSCSPSVQFSSFFLLLLTYNSLVREKKEGREEGIKRRGMRNDPRRKKLGRRERERERGREENPSSVFMTQDKSGRRERERCGSPSLLLLLFTHLSYLPLEGGDSSI